MSGWRCSTCAAANPPGTRFCGSCGDARVRVAGPDVLWSCQACHAANVIDAAWCGHCGTRRTAKPRVEERREVTALFADISGFTTLADRLQDEEALHGVIEPVIAAMAQIAERYEGTVAKYAGDALLVFFGAPVAHEDDAVRALRVALEMHAELPGILGSLPDDAQHLELHIGVNTGRVVAGQFGGDVRSDYSILGDAVNVAQRLESVAPSGATYVGQRTRDLAHRDFAFEWVGDLELKGKLAAVPAWRLVGTHVATPERGTIRSGAAGPLVGRRRELEQVDAHIAGLAAGRGGGLVTLVGEPGVGKSRLLAEARRRAEAAGLRWIQVRVPSFGAALTYWPFAETVRALADVRADHGPEDARRLLHAAPGTDARLVPLLARLVGVGSPDDFDGVEPDEIRHRLHNGVVEWLLRLGDERPTVLAIEDAHWIDHASTDLAAELARATQGWPIALVVTSRTEGADTVERIASRVDDSYRATFRLDPLERDGITQLLESLLEGEPPPELVRTAEVRSSGNPLFLTELVRTLIAERALTFGDGVWRMRTGWTASSVPDSVERLLSSRIDLLDPEPASLLSAASVVGRLVRLPLLRAVTPAEDLDAHLDHLVAAGFLDPVADGDADGFLFHHALVQEVAYARLLRKRRVELHRQLAESAERLYGTGDDVVELLARHSYLGERGAIAVEYLARAGRRAAALYANDEAIGHLGRALEVDPQAHHLRTQLADLLAVVGEYDQALEAYRSGPRTLRDRLGEADVLRQRGAYADAERALEAAIDDVGPEDPSAAGIWYRLGRTRMIHGNNRRGIEALECAVRLAGEDLATTASALVSLCAGCADEGRVDDAIQYGLFARRLYERIGDLRGLGAAQRAVGDALAHGGRFGEGAEALRHGLDLAQRTGDVEEAAGTLINLGMLELQRGDLHAAAAYDRRAAVEFARLGHGAGQAVSLGNLAEKLLLLGELDDADRCCEQALARAVEIGHGHCVADVTLTRAMVRERQGRLDEAAALADEAALRFADLDAPTRAARAADVAARARSSVASATSS